MNRVYYLRYSAVIRGFIAVSEFARNCTCRVVGKKHLKAAVLLLSPLLLSGPAGASIVSSEIDYQIFRDFAENKGAFRPGATDIAIYNKQGELVGTLDKAAMPDFSAVDSEIGVATLINPQYIASVKHNGGYKNVSFGDGENRYNIVDRNEHGSQDFHAPRLDKLVTEVIPASVTEEGQKTNAYANTERYTAFYRAGSGTQYIKDRSGNVTQISGAYSYLTGGTVGAPSSSDHIIASSPGNVFNPINGPLSSYGAPGDSGSPLFAYDSWQKKWVMVGVLSTWTGEHGVNNRWAVIPLDFIGQKFNEDNDAPVTFRTSEGGALEWSFNSSTGAGALTQGGTTYAMHGQQGNDLNAGKNLIFQGKNGQINFKDSVSQGAGSLTFRDNYTVTTSNGSTWTGAGIVVDNGVSVNWQVNGVKGDNLHKIGEGTLTVQGTGINEGGLKVGDGKVVLNQQADNKGQVQAFSSVNIASGRPTVVLTDERQVNPDTVSWGYRGGTLDVNGNSLTFHQLKAADYGAVLANNADKRATITLDYALRADKVALNGWSESRKGTTGNLYKYNNPYTNTTDYFILKQSTYGYFPTDQSSNATWEFVGHSQGDAQKLVADRFNTAGYLFHGQLKGNLNVDNRLSEGVTGALVMDGSADISGTFTQENGRLTLQGHPVIHAYNTQSVADKLAASGDHSVLTQPTSFSQEDWENRSFTFDRLSLKNTDFGLGRNATLNTTLEATDSMVTLGDSRVFIDKNDGNGTAFTLEEGTSEAVKDADRSVFNGSAVLNGKTTLDIMNATFNGDISGHVGSHVELSRRSHWNMTKSSTLDSFRSKGGTLSLVTDNWSPKTLTVNTLHASSMNIAMGVSTADNTGDRIDILNKATGGHNTLDMSSLFDQTVTLKNDLTLASAPVGTSHGYFSFASLNRGFTVYTPDTQVQEKDGRVYWQLKSHAGTTESQVSTDVSDDVTDTTSPIAPDTGSTGSTEADGIVSEGNNSNGVSPSPDSPAENVGTTVNGSSLFKAADNTSLLKKARAMFAAREFILSDSADRWTQVVDNSDADGGAWAMTGYSHGGYDDFSLNQSGLNVGFRQSAAGNAWWGMGAEFYRGHSSTDDYRDDFSLWGLHVLVGKSFAGGLFVDGMTGYRDLSEDYTIQGELSDLSGRAKSHILTAGIRGGWKMHAAPFDMSITPTVSLNGARVDGNRLQGRERSVELHDGDALWLKAGVEAEKVSGNITLKAGIWRNITLNDMPGMTLRDDLKARHYDAEKADRYTVSFGINGKLTEKLSVQAKVNSSFDGYFKTDAEGVLDIRYDF
ncbi:autotransporter outer membrane beta-barrel domain-containing protein [Escherichia coli]|uniref:Autotransporter outer membrane beta-barrel domain-containing protein n=1 Tax=Escherichia coli TaxID=562 RepID=A0A6D0V655_ECOLX|nr:S6 family peptidase [Escherichia coli]MZW00557.1 autotransporter outer membrane beta-barrel domain-containing protein [Escherichia coli]NAG07262.1 autotransporter outer membrane beta-barrel domain-containing protein [Escherichia coli]NAG21780.1 autotransporter outer membrane beta-barrel domain-containing protein [Escherichia coli]NAG36660.1 autotransporter outer membrane beta-barrel domain-containing protein [Escherichia coli]NAG42030.1 autotransporter outer membrane beta-barrel domain-cont